MNRRAFAGNVVNGFFIPSILMEKKMDCDDAINQLERLKMIFIQYVNHVKEIDQTDYMESFRASLGPAQVKMLELMGYE
jgi:tRNA uridine 5-carbamoylmethylation protein Kti12